MKQIFAFMLVLAIFYSCSEKKKQQEYNPEAIEINDKAIASMQRMELDSALALFDQAIELDATYHHPHSNKTAIYISRKQYPEALHEAEQTIKKKPDLAEGWTLAAILHETQGDSITAMQYYLKSIELFDERIRDPKKADRIAENRLNRIFSLVLAGQDLQAEEETRQLLAENPDNLTLLQLTGISKEDFIRIILMDEE